MSVIHIESTEQFKSKVLTGEMLSVIDFRAEWCGPCRMLGPIMEELAKDNDGKNVQIVKINVDEHPDIAGQFGVSSIPAVFFVKGGQVVDALVGAMPKMVFQQKIDTLLAPEQKPAA
jgi:thioredoxin 1